MPPLFELLWFQTLLSDWLRFRVAVEVAVNVAVEVAVNVAVNAESYFLCRCGLMMRLRLRLRLVAVAVAVAVVIFMLIPDSGSPRSVLHYKSVLLRVFSSGIIMGRTPVPTVY